MLKNTAYIIDGYNLIFRMFYAVPQFRTRDGDLVNAVFGVTKTMINMLQNPEEKPQYLILALDAGSDTFRRELYSEYKGTRDKMPDELASQIDKILKVFELLKIGMLIKPGFEADDIIGTLATSFNERPDLEQIFILSSDKDLYQFIGAKTKIYDMMKKKVFGIDASHEKFGVSPDRIVDYLAIVGDSSDNIPGVKGLGPKGAAKLINQYGGIEDIYDHIDEIPGSTQAKLIESRENAFLSKKLATIDIEVDMGDVEPEVFDITDTQIFTPELIEFLRENEFNSLIPKDLADVGVSRPESKLTQVTDVSDLESLLMSKSVVISTSGDRD